MFINSSKRIVYIFYLCLCRNHLEFETYFNICVVKFRVIRERGEMKSKIDKWGGKNEKPTKPTIIT